MTSASLTRYVGASSGTSVDGLDIAVIEVAAESLRIVSGTTVPFAPSLRRQLLSLGAAEVDDIDSLGSTDALLGRFIGDSINACLASNGIGTESIRAIGSHGQTVRHRSRANPPFTIQIGDPNLIAELTGITTVADFRRRDIAAGGEGAPLVPLFHHALFGAGSAEPRSVLNIGGMANVTSLPTSPTKPIEGFDTGPGNTLLDAWARANLGEPFDRDGEWSSKGNIIARLLEAFMRDPYFAQPPPKSTGREAFGLDWLKRHLESLDTPPQPEDVQSTLAELTARSIADGLDRWGHTSGLLIVAGGGRLNRELMSRIQRLLPSHRVQTSDQLGVNGDWLEAAAFAWLAHRTLEGLAGNAPAVTGAKAARVLGAVYAGNRPG